MERTAKIVSNAGILHISSPSGHHLDVLHKELTFDIGEQRTKKIRKFNRVTGETTIIEIPAGMSFTKRALYTEEGNDFFTLSGYYERVRDCLKKFGFRVQYEFLASPPGRRRIEPLIDDITFGSLLPDNMKMRPEQENCLVEMFSSREGAITEMAMGSGKTHVIAGLIRGYRLGRGVITVRQKAVVKRLYEGLPPLLHGTGITLGLKVSGRRHTEGQFVLTTDKGLSSFDDCDVDVVVADECHGFGADTVSNSLAALPNSIKFGMTATNKRNDGKHHIVEGFFGPIKFHYTDEEAEGDGRVVPIKVFMPVNDEGPEIKDGYSKIKKERLAIWENKIRNQLAVDICREAPPDHQLLIFVRTIIHLQELKSMLGPEFVEIHAELNPKEQDRRQKAFERGEILRIISTDVLGVGIDPQALRIILDWNHTTSDQTLIQRLGRNRRHAIDKEFGVVIRPWDSWWEGAQQRSATAARSYRKRGFEVTKITSLNQIQWQ